MREVVIFITGKLLISTVGLAWLVVGLVFFFKRLMQKKTDKRSNSCFSRMLNHNCFGKICAGYRSSEHILGAGRQGLVLRFTELNKNSHPL